MQARALGKAQSVIRSAGEGPVIGVDTEVVLDDGRVLGQPVDASAALKMLTSLAGRKHRVLSGIAVLGMYEQVACAQTIVRFRALDAAELGAYVARGEWRGRAGGYAIQESGAALIAEIRGDYANVVGLPVTLLQELLAREGISIVPVEGISNTE